MSSTEPPRSPPAGHLDQLADANRDLGAVATALCYEKGLLPDMALTRAIEAYREGDTVRVWWERAIVGSDQG